MHYNNATVSGCPDVTVELLQKVQDMAARITLNKRLRDSARQCLKSLHWLPI